MAYTIPQTPPLGTYGYAGAYDPIVYVVYESTFATFTNFRYTCSIQVVLPDASVVDIPIIKLYPNAKNYGVFNVSTLVKNYVNYDVFTDDAIPIWSSTDKAEQTVQAIAKITLTFGYVYSIDNVDQPVVIPSGTINSLYVTSGFYSDQFSDRLSWNTFLYSLGTVQKNFLSVSQEQTITSKDQSVISFLNNLSSGGTDIVEYVSYIEYDVSGTVLATNTYDIGAIAGGSSAVNHHLIHIPSGPENIQPYITLNAATSYYTVHLENNISVQISVPYKYTLVNDCRFTTERLCFANHLGGYDYLTFYGNNSILTDTVERRAYEQFQGNTYDTNGSTVPYTQYGEDGGSRIFYIDGDRKMTLNTGQTNESINTDMKTLMASPEVYLAYDGGYTPVTVVDSSIDYKTSVSEGTFNYTVTIKFSHKLQSLT